VVIVDAAIRTGDSMSALAQALQTECSRRDEHRGLLFLNALSRMSRRDLASSLGIEIRTLFDVALAPPTERVRNWISSRKAMIRDVLSESGQFSELGEFLRSYCE